MSAQVSCMMITYNRRPLVPAAIQNFLGQTLQASELVIVDHGEDKVEDLVPKDNPRIQYIKLRHKVMRGDARNVALEATKGDVVAIWDDDNWSHPDRLQTQVQSMWSGHKPLSVLSSFYAYMEAVKEVWLYNPIVKFTLDPTAMYLKASGSKFPSVDRDETVAVIRSIPSGDWQILNRPDLFLFGWNPGRTQPRPNPSPFWHKTALTREQVVAGLVPSGAPQRWPVT